MWRRRGRDETLWLVGEFINVMLSNFEVGRREGKGLIEWGDGRKREGLRYWDLGVLLVVRSGDERL